LAVSATSDTLGSWIVVFNDQTSDPRGLTSSLVLQHGGKQQVVWEAVLKGAAISGISSRVAAAIARHPSVKYVEVDGEGSISPSQVLPPGGSGSPLWFLDRIDTFGSPAYDGLFTYSRTGVGVHVYILDTGVRGGHSEFTGRIGNGTCVIPFSWGCSQTIDAHGHGTGVASVAAGTIYGIAKAATIHPVRIDDDGANIACSTQITGLDWVRTNAQFPAVANMSVNGYPSCFSVRDAINALVAANVLVSKSAGNNNVDAFSDRSNRSPGSVVTGALDPADWRSTFSNWGPTVAVMAPGQNMRVAWSTDNNAFQLVSGTSFAAPQAAGIAATILEANPTMGSALLRSTLLGGANPTAVGNAFGVPHLVLYSLLP
jgi:subtilisin family serine protease